MNFKNTQLNEAIIKAVTDIGYEDMTPIQEQAIPLVLEGKDLIGQSQTGTGKTAAFMLPILHKIEMLDKRIPQALILTPTRELALQIANETRKFAKYLQNVKTVTVYGGEPITKQINDLKGGCDIVVATPGRVLDHIRRRTLRFKDCRTLILDEADEMLNMGFIDEIKEVLSYLPDEKQVLLFSATMPKAIVELSRQFQTEPVIVNTVTESVTVSKIKQVYYQVHSDDKLNLLMQLLSINKNKSIMIFSNTKKMVDELASKLNRLGYNVSAIHGDMRQTQRTDVMNKFKSGENTLLIATDVAARGIDIKEMEMVINYDLPQEMDYYVHRVGRTGRAGSSGMAISFVNNRQSKLLKEIEKHAKTKLEKLTLPTTDELKEANFQQMLDKIVDLTPNGQVRSFLEYAEDKGIDSKQLLYGLLNIELDKTKLKPLKNTSDEPKKKRANQDYFSFAFNIGSKQEISPAHLVSAISSYSDIPGKEIGKISIQDRSSTVQIPKELREKVETAMTESIINGKNVIITSITEVKSTGDKRGNGSKRPDSRRSNDSRRSRGNSDRGKRESSGRKRTSK